MARSCRQSRNNLLLKDLQFTLAKSIIHTLANFIIYESILAFFLPVLQLAQSLALQSARLPAQPHSNNESKNND